jgi:hypothetical protein
MTTAKAKAPGARRNPGRRRHAAGQGKSPYAEALRVAEITPAAVKKRLSYRLAQIVGPGRRLSFAEASKLTGIKERTIRAYVDGKACPNLARYERMLLVFGPEIGIELAYMLGWEPRGASRPQPSTAHLAELRHGVAQALATIEHVLVEIKDRQPPILKSRP